MPIKLKVNYFPHDYDARNDPKLLTLQMKMGGAGLAIFWCLVEMLWSNAGYYPCAYNTISYHLPWAKADDIRCVIEQFDLFESDGEKFWSNAVLTRMEMREKISETRANSGREGGIQSGISRREKANASKTGTDAEANASDIGRNSEATASSPGSNKERNNGKRIKKESDYNEEEEKMKVFELFFFKNFVSPEFELNRFWEYYTLAEWRTSDGKAITDKIRVANSWTPQKTDPRFRLEFLSWYKMVYSTVKNHNAMDNPYEMLTGLGRVVYMENSLLISFKTKELAEKVSSFVLENNLKTSYSIDWKFGN